MLFPDFGEKAREGSAIRLTAAGDLLKMKGHLSGKGNILGGGAVPVNENGALSPFIRSR